MTYPTYTSPTYPLYRHQAFRRLDSIAGMILRLSFSKVYPSYSKDKRNGTGEHVAMLTVNDDYFQRVQTFLENEYFTVKNDKGILKAHNTAGDTISVKYDSVQVVCSFKVGDYPVRSQMQRMFSALLKYPWTGVAVLVWVLLLSWYAFSNIDAYKYEWKGLYLPALLASVIPLVTLFLEDKQFAKQHPGYYPRGSRTSFLKYYPRTLGLAVILGLLICVPDAILHGLSSGLAFGLGMAIIFPVAASVIIPIVVLPLQLIFAYVTKRQQGLSE